MTTTATKLLLGLLGGGAAGFSPLDIPGLALWLDASDSATLFQDSAGTTPATADNDVVGMWADKSGNGRHATQATTANKPTLTVAAQNGKDGVLFDGVNDCLPFANTLDLGNPSLFVVCSLLSHGSIHAILEFKQGTLLAEFFSYTTLYINEAVPSSFLIGASTSIVSVIVHAPNNMDYTLNGGSAETKTSGTGYQSRGASQVGANAGTGQVFDGPIFELVAFSGALTATERDSVRTYLNAKWGVY